MAEAETQKEMKERIMMWKYLQAVIDFKRGNANLEETAQRMSYWSDGIDPEFCKFMLKDLKKENVVQLMRAKPELPGLPPLD